MKNLTKITVLWINGFNKNPDPAFYVNVDPDPLPDPVHSAFGSQKRTSSTSEYEINSYFSILFLPSRIRINRPISMRIRIHNTEKN
jgi:hypothetical protein